MFKSSGRAESRGNNRSLGMRSAAAVGCWTTKLCHGSQQAFMQIHSFCKMCHQKWIVRYAHGVICRKCTWKGGMQLPSSVHLFHVRLKCQSDCVICTWAGLLVFCCSSLSWKISASWFKARVSPRAADETVNKSCCGSLNKELPEFRLSKMRRDLAYEPTPLILD